jgi:glucose-6-phosphate 1-epimerase
MTASGNRLDLTMGVDNPGTEPFTFTAALHSYLAAEPEATLHGLDGATAEDNAAGLAEITLPAGPLPATATRDLAIRDLAGDVRLRRPVGDLLVQRSGFADLVLWNPGPEHGLRDVPDGPAAFACLEPAQLSPVTLAPGQTWTASVILTYTRRQPHP